MGIFGQSQDGQARYSGELHNLALTQSVFGTTAPIVFGTRRVAAKLLFYGGFTATPAPGQGKGLGGGKGDTQYDYYADMNLALASGSASGGCQGILSVWDQQGKLSNQNQVMSFTITAIDYVTVPPGDALIVDLGAYSLQPYSQYFNDYGGASGTLNGNQQVPFVNTTGAPVSGQYSFNSATGQYTFSPADAGKTVYISYSTVFSLYYFEQTQAAEVPLSSPYQISTNNQQYFWSDGGVVSVATGAPVSYTESGGVYTFPSSLAGQLVYITYVYTSSDSDITNTSTLNLTFFGGELGQAPSSYMQSKYPGAAFGYTGTCYLLANPMALGESATTPSYNYEVVGLDIFPGGGLDAHACDAFRTLLYDAFLGVGFPYANVDAWTSCYAYWAANNYLVSISLDTQTSVADAMGKVIETGNVGAVCSGGLLKLIPYGDATCVGNGYTYTPNTTPVAALTWNDLLPPSEKEAGESGSEDPLQVSRKAPQDCWNYVQAQWCNRLNDYNNELINEQNDAFVNDYGRRIESPQTWDWITAGATASWALNLRLKRQCYISNTYKFWLPFRFARIEPMDIVTLPTGENVRIIQKEDAPDGRLAFEAEEWKYGTGSVTLYPKQGSTSFQPTISQAVPASTYAVIFETPAQGTLPQPNAVQIAVAGNQSNWGGCDVYASQDGATYEQIGSVIGAGRNGLLSAALAAGSDPDTVDTLSVDMTLSGGELVGATAAAANTFATLCAIVDASGTVELVSYETATLTAPNKYNLTYLRRGVYGTPILAHAAGAEFCYIGISGLFEYVYPVQYLASTVYFKFASFNLAGNQTQALSACQPYSYRLQGAPYPDPPIVTVTQSATNGSGSGSSNAASAAITPTASGGVTTTAIVWLTITWTWPANYPKPTSFEVVAFTGSDPTVAANYLFPIATVGPTILSYTVAVTPTVSMGTVNAAVRAVYA